MPGPQPAHIRPTETVRFNAACLTLASALYQWLPNLDHDPLGMNSGSQQAAQTQKLHQGPRAAKREIEKTGTRAYSGGLEIQATGNNASACLRTAQQECQALTRRSMRTQAAELETKFRIAEFWKVLNRQ